MEAAATALGPGARVGEYVVGEPLRARRGMTAYRALQPSVDRRVALYLAQSPAGTPGADAFLTRARALVGVDQPNLVPVYDVGTAGQHAYAATPLVGGRRASEVTAESPLTPEAAVSVVEQLAAALEALEAVGVPAGADPVDVLLSWQGDTPIVMLEPLDTGAPSVPPATALADLLEVLTGSTEVTEAARRAAAADSPSAVAAAARAALEPPRRRRRRIRPALAVSLVALLAALATAVAVLTTGDERSGGVGATAPARVVATIPIGAEPLGLAAVGHTLWVSTLDGRLSRVDMRTNRVAGAPLRPEPGTREPLWLLAGAGSLYALDGDGNEVERLDPSNGRVLRRHAVRHGTPMSAAIVNDTLWIAVQPFDDDPAGQSQVLPFDSHTLTPSGHGAPVGALPTNIAVDGDALLVTGYGDGTLTRVDTRTRDARRVQVGVKPGSPALVAGRLWVPDGLTGVVAAIDPLLQRPPSTIAPVGGSSHVVESRGAPWALVADQYSGATAPAHLLRLDRHTGYVVGRPVALGRGVQNIVAGAGDLWASSQRRRSILRIALSNRVPASHPAIERNPTRLRSGPSRPGRRAAAVAGQRFSLDPGPGWSVTVSPEGVDLRRFDDPGIGLLLTVPETVFGPGGSTQRARDSAAIVRSLQAVRGLRITHRRHTSLAGTPGQSMMLSVMPSASKAEFCPGPCLPILGRARMTVFVAAPGKARMTLVRLRGRPFVLFEDTPDGRSLPLTDQLVRSLRIG